MANRDEQEGMTRALTDWRNQQARGFDAQAGALEALRRALLDAATEGLRRHGEARVMIEGLTKELQRIKRQLSALTTVRS